MEPETKPNAFAVYNKKTMEVYIGWLRMDKGTEPIWMMQSVAATIIDQLETFIPKNHLGILNITKSRLWNSKYKPLIESGEMNPIYGTWKIKLNQ